MRVIRNLLRRLAKGRSGNAALLVALGAPALIGGAGMGVDVAQWYMWKRELQYAVDQAAIAGAWAKAADEAGTTYITRATQEYNASVSLTADFDSGPTITLEDYDGGTDNSIQVVASATQKLPFSSFLTGESATVTARAVAIFEPGASYNPCMLALDPDAASAMLLNGNVTVTAACGIGAISDDPNAVSKIGGSGNVNVGFVITSGGIDDEHGHFNQEARIEGASGLSDPYDGLTPPNNSTPRSLSCAQNNHKYTADETVKTKSEYAYFKGKNKNNLTAYPDYPDAKPTTTSQPTTTVGMQFPTEPVNSEVVGTPTLTEVAGAGNDKVWERKTDTTIKTYSNIVAPAVNSGDQLPGTYTDFTISCDTVLTSGVYVLDGALLKLEGGHSLSGSGVMLVLKNGAGIQVAGNSKMNLTAMTKSQLIAAGVSEEDAGRMLGMLIFEDPDSPGATGNKLTGTSDQILNGVIYTPNSALHVAGTPKGTSQCMVVAVKTLQFSGSVDVTSLCPANVTPNAAVLDQKSVVRLVG